MQTKEDAPVLPWEARHGSHVADRMWIDGWLQVVWAGGPSHGGRRSSGALRAIGYSPSRSGSGTLLSVKIGSASWGLANSSRLGRNVFCKMDRGDRFHLIEFPKPSAIATYDAVSRVRACVARSEAFPFVGHWLELTAICRPPVDSLAYRHKLYETQHVVVESSADTTYSCIGWIRGPSLMRGGFGRCVSP